MWNRTTYGYPNAALSDLNIRETNWSAVGCQACMDIRGICYPPTVGSYASTLSHYEAALGGTLPGCPTWPHGPRKTRLLVLFQDPRGVPKFPVADPILDPRELKGSHRYFLLTPLAWKVLELDRATGAPGPSWPSEDTAHLFLRRYFGIGPGGRSWAYDGFIAYFLWLFQPAAAYVTNLAKCHFGTGTRQPPEVFSTCGRKHLRQEIEALRPDLILSFTSKAGSSGAIVEWTGIEPGAAVLRALHPAAQASAEKKAKHLERVLCENQRSLSELGHDTRALIARWTRHQMRARDQET